MSTARLTVYGGKREASALSGRLFGNFLEHIGPALQGGLLAQLLSNPSFAANINLTAEQRKRLLENGSMAENIHKQKNWEEQKYLDWKPSESVTGFGVMVADDQTEYGIPLPWKVTPHTAGTGRKKGRVGHSVELALDGGRVLLQQGVYLPHQRDRRYEGHLWIKAIGKGSISVGFKKRGAAAEEYIAETGLDWPGEYWEKAEFKLIVPERSLCGMEPVDFTISAAGNGKICVDRAVLLPSDHICGFDPEMVEEAKKLSPPVLRGPGGNFVSGYHFWHGIGDLDYRQTFSNPAWGGIENNFFGTDDFLKFCELIGAEPHICVNMGDGTAEEAAAWVEYANGPADSAWGQKRSKNGHPEPYGVKLWEIGNEIYSEAQVGHCGDIENARRFREWSRAMKAVDPGIEILATGNDFDYVEPHHHYPELLLEQGGEHLECITLHQLHSNRLDSKMEPDEVWNFLMANTERYEKIHLPGLKKLIEDRRPGQNIQLAITEWGILGIPEYPKVSNIGGAIYAGLFYNMVMRMKEQIRVTNATAIFHGGCIRKVGTIVYTDPQVEVIRRYTELAGGHILPVCLEGPSYNSDAIFLYRDLEAPQCDNVPIIDAVCVLDKEGRINTAIVNRHCQEALTLEINYENTGSLELVSCEEMKGEGLTDTNTPLMPDRVKFVQKNTAAAKDHSVTLEISPRSIVWIRHLEKGI